MPLHLLVKWGRWFLQIVDIHVGNFNMKLTGRWFSQIVQWESISNIYITKIVVLVSEPVRGRSRATELPCFTLGPIYEKLVIICFPCYKFVCSVMRSYCPWNFRSPGFDIRAPQDPPNMKKILFLSYFGFKLKNLLSDCFLISHIHMGERIAGEQDRPSLVIEDPLRAPKIAPKYTFLLHFGP